MWLKLRPYFTEEPPVFFLASILKRTVCMDWKMWINFIQNHHIHVTEIDRIIHRRTFGVVYGQYV